MRKSPLLPIFLIVFVDVLGLTIIIPLLPIYAETLGASAFTVGMLISSYGLCQLIAGPIMGQLSDRLGRKPLLIVSQIGTFIGFLILAFSRTLAVVFLSRIIDGLTAGNISVAQAYISDVTTPKNRARSFGLIGIAFGMGFLIGPAISGLLAKYGTRVPILAAAALSLTSILTTIAILPSKAPRPEGEAEPVASARSSKLPLRIVVESLFKPKLGSVLWQFFFFTFAFSLFISGFPLFAERRFLHAGHPFGVQEISYALAFMGLLGVIIQGGLIGKLVARFGEGRLVVAGFVSMALSDLLLSGIHTAPLLLLAIVGLSFGISVVRPALTSLVTFIVPRDEQGMAIGLTQSMMSVSQITAPLLAGALINHGRLGIWACAAAFTCVLGIGMSAARARG